MKRDAGTIAQMFAAVSLGAPENAVGFVLWRIAARYQREIDRALVDADLTNLQFITLALVAWAGRDHPSTQRPCAGDPDAGESVTQIELARAAGIHPMQISQTLKVLEAKKLVSRRRSRVDTRAKRVEVTSAGLLRLREAFPKVIGVQEHLFGEAGRPGGRLLMEMLRVDRDLLEKAP